MMKNPDCLFCKIASHGLSSSIRYEDAEVMAFDDIHPKAAIHVLLIPKEHISSVNELPDDPAMIGRLILRLKTLAFELGLKERGYKIVINTGRGGGQMIDHLHLHLLSGEKIGSV